MKIPNGFRFAGVHSGIKKASNTEDISLVVADEPCVAAAVYTKNQVVAAPVVLDRERTPASNIRAVITNSGNANACTGELGMQNALRMAALTAEAIGADPDQVLVMSTGIIGEQLPMDEVTSGIAAVTKQLGDSEDHFMAAARGIMTTDLVAKTSFREFESSGESVQILGMAKGSGMIGPNMATMLGLVLTNAELTPEQAQRFLTEFTDRSFNSINVDGHTSTNDTVILLSSGKVPLTSDGAQEFSKLGLETCVDLAKQIVQDGEGASHLIEISVSGATSDGDARVIAEAIANSPLVKTAFAGNDPNWGRIVSAAGYAGPKIDVAQTKLRLNGVVLFDAGAPVAFDATKVSADMKANRDVLVELVVGSGNGSTTFWTCDLTHGYVTINAEYHT